MHLIHGRDTSIYELWCSVTSQLCGTTVKWMQWIWRMILKQCTTIVWWTECKRKFSECLHTEMHISIYSLMLSHRETSVLSFHLVKLYNTTQRPFAICQRTNCCWSLQNGLSKYQKPYAIKTQTQLWFVHEWHFHAAFFQCHNNCISISKRNRTSPGFPEVSTLVQRWSFLKQCDFVFLCNFLLMQCTICTVSQCNGYNKCVWQRRECVCVCICLCYIKDSKTWNFGHCWSSWGKKND